MSPRGAKIAKKSGGKHRAETAPTKRKISSKRAEADEVALIERDEDEGEVIAPQRKLRRRNTDQLVAKKVRDNFPGWTMEQTHLRLCNGRSLRGTIRDDCRDDGIVMGKKYYDTIRSQFVSDDSPEALLKPRNDNDPIDSLLLEALTATLKHRRSYQELLDWSETVDAVNQKN